MLKEAGILFAITLIAGLLLGFVYELTKEPIRQQEEKAVQEACQAVFADAEHFEELDASVIDKALVGTDASKSKEERLLSALKLVRIGFYPGKENYAVWDYTIGREIADMLVVVNTDNTGKINYVTWES